MVKAVGYKKKGSIDRDDALIDFELSQPTPGEFDLLVEIRAISVNPADYKIRTWLDPEQGTTRVLGWDAAGIVADKGALVRGFEIGDRIYYAGDLDRQGTNAEYNLVDLPRRLQRQQPIQRPLHCR